MVKGHKIWIFPFSFFCAVHIIFSKTVLCTYIYYVNSFLAIVQGVYVLATLKKLAPRWFATFVVYKKNCGACVCVYVCVCVSTQMFAWINVCMQMHAQVLVYTYIASIFHLHWYCIKNAFILCVQNCWNSCVFRLCKNFLSLKLSLDV